MSETTTLRLWQVAITEKAICVSKTPKDRDPECVWLPRSMIEHITRFPQKEPDGWPEIHVKMQEWFAEKKGLL